MIVHCICSSCKCLFVNSSPCQFVSNHWLKSLHCGTCISLHGLCTDSFQLSDMLDIWLNGLLLYHYNSEGRDSWKLKSGAWSWLRTGLSQGSALHFQHLSQRPWSPLCSLERIVTQPNMSIQNLAQNIYVFILWFDYFCTLDWNKLKIIKVINDDNQHIGAWSMIKPSHWFQVLRSPKW